MKKVFIITLFVIVSQTLGAQDKICSIPRSQDPCFLYIQQYMPEYYYDDQVIAGDPSQKFTISRISVKVRVMKNHADNKTFTYLILRKGSHGEYITLYTDEVDPLISYLKRVEVLMKEIREDDDYYVFNSRCGLFLKAEKNPFANNSAYPPYYHLSIFFPEGDRLKITNKNEISDIIYKLVAAKDCFPPKDCDFLYNDEGLDDKWETREMQDNDLKSI